MNRLTLLLKSAIVSFMLLSFLSCGNSESEKLSKVERYLDRQENDSAIHLLKTINYSDLDDDDSKNTYALLRTRVDNLEGYNVESDTLVNQCLRYFIDKKDNNRIAECYYYLAIYNYDQGQVKKAFWNICKANYHAEQTNDIALKHKVTELILDWYNTAEEYSSALSYGKKNLYLSTLAGDKNWLAYAYAMMATTYYGLRLMEKSEEFLNKSMEYISSVPRKEQAQFYVSLGSTIIDSAPAKARVYFSKAIKANEDATAYSGLAILEYQDGHLDTSEEYLRKALTTNDESTKMFVYSNMLSMYSSKGDYKKALECSMNINKLQAGKFKEQKDKSLTLVQRQFASQIEHQRFKRRLSEGFFIVFIAILLVIAIYIYLRFKNEHWKKNSLENLTILNVYKDKLNKLKEKGSQSEDSVQEEKKIQEKIDTIQKRQSKILYNGQILYQDILDGKNTLTWNKRDYENFLEYYKVVDLPFVTQLQAEYDHLSPRYQFFLALKNMGKTEEVIQDIMVISSGTIRVIKSRLKASKLE
ncbi:tetratricopeptide repeat protein [Prevotella sp.]|uniref:tetratricopeptide repeat protein n=1 Tax=Prevotella sp. TaxID=59823 RepID=UPI002649031C|nr:hypothetical protein [Prevotella sp.]